MKQKLLLGQQSETKILFENSEEGKPKKIYIEGITLQGNVKNGNGRIYPTPILQEAVNSHCESSLDIGGCVGELGHPSTNLHKINYNNVSHKFVKVEQHDNNIYTKALVLEEGKGKILRNFIENEVRVGISSRGFGPTKLVEGTEVIQNFHLITLGDIEHNPSAPDAFLTAIMENKEWVFENGLLVERDISESIDQYKDIIKKASKSQIKEAANKVFADFFKILSK